MKEETIHTLHPEGKQGVTISRQKYDAVRGAIVAGMTGKGEVPLQDLRRAVESELEGRFDGSISWYFETVKLDLEARGTIERVADRKPQHIRLLEA